MQEIIYILIPIVATGLVGWFLNSKIEKLRNDLRTSAYEHEVRFAKLHEKRTEVIAELNAKLAKALGDLVSFLSPCEFSGEPSKEEKASFLQKSANEFKMYFNQNRIYFDDILCDDIDNFIRSLEKSGRDFALSLPNSPLGKTEMALKLQDTAWEILEKETMRLRKNIEERFRKLLDNQN